MLRTRATSACLALGSVALFGLAVWAAWGGVFQGLRWALLFVSLAAGAASPRWAIQAVIVSAPLLPVVSRVALETGNLSLAEHMVVGLLAGVLLRSTRADRGPVRSPINAAQLLFVAVVVGSLLRVMYQYARAGVGPADFSLTPLSWCFAPALGHFGWDRFVVLRHTVLFVEAGLWWAALLAPATGLRSAELRRGVVYGALLCTAIGVVQSWWPFAPSPHLGRANLELLRITATWPDNNTLGSYLVLVAPLALAEAAQARRRTTILVLGAVTMAYVLLASASRSALVGVVASIGVAAAFIVWSPDTVGMIVSPRTRRAILSFGGGVLFVVAAAVVTITGFDLGRRLDYPRVSNLASLAVLSLNLRRPASEILADRPWYWERALALWRRYPLVGIGIGRFGLWKENPDDGILAAGPGGAGPGIGVPNDPLFDRWVNAVNGLNFETADVLAGDTIESAHGGWGPITITGRWSATQLTLEHAAPPTEKGDYVIRHPQVTARFEPHAHRGPNPLMPFWTTAHNFYLGLLSELGLIGVTAFAVLIAAVGWEARRGLALTDAADRQWIAAATLGIFGFLVASLAQDPLTVREIQYVFWALVGFIVLRRRERTPRP